MMTHDPYQTYPGMGAYGGVTTPFTSPYANPAAALNPLAAAVGLPAIPTAGIPQLGQQGYAGYPVHGGINPQQLQLALLFALQGLIPQTAGLSPQTGGWQNPLLYPLAQQHVPYSPIGQINPLLAPQSWVGQPGLPGGGQAFNPIHALASQLGPRPFPAAGISPWALF
jgi:hypothetical protein